MNRKELEEYIVETYDSQPEFPWIKNPNHMVFRHANNRKWFALVMEIHAEKLGLPAKGMRDIVNVKCDPILIGTLLKEYGFYPAYHMNKSNWITILLDSGVDDEKIKWLLDMSFDMTAKKIKKSTEA